VTRPWGRRCALTLLLLLGALTVLLRTAPPAVAHAYTIATSPSDGTEVAALPAQVRVTFDEPVTLPAAKGAASVLDEGGREVGSGSVRLVDGRRTLVIGIRPGLPKGSYLASWSVVSSDTHPVGGSLQFGYGVPANPVGTAPSPRPSAALELAAGVVKGLLYLGLVAAFGTLPAGLVLGADRDERRALVRTARAGVVLALLASAAQVAVQYLWDASAVPGGPTWAGLRAFAGSDYGQAVYVRAGLLAAALAVLPRLRGAAGGWWAAGAVLALAALGSVVRNGHGGTGSWWHFATTLVHVSCVVAWIGGLAVLGWLVLRRPPTPHRLTRLPLWSRYAATSVATLATTGLIQAVRQVRYLPALTTTTYGYVLLLKLTLVTSALLLAFRGNRWVVTRTTRRIAHPPQANADHGPGTPGVDAGAAPGPRTATASGAEADAVSGPGPSTATGVDARAAHDSGTARASGVDAGAGHDSGTARATGVDPGAMNGSGTATAFDAGAGHDPSVGPHAAEAHGLRAVPVSGADAAHGLRTAAASSSGTGAGHGPGMATAPGPDTATAHASRTATAPGPGPRAGRSAGTGPDAGAGRSPGPRGGGGNHPTPRETARLRGWVRVEAGVGAVIVVVSGVLSSVAPAAEAYAPARTLHAVIGPYTVTFEVAPARRGPQSFRVTAVGAAESTALPRSVQLDLGQDAGAVKDLRVRFPYRLPGAIRPGKATAFTFVSSSVDVPAKGGWTATLTLVAGPAEQYTGALRYRVL
jgi:copper transport protein